MIAVLLAVGAASAALFWWFLSRPETRGEWASELQLVVTVLGFAVAVIALLHNSAQTAHLSSRANLNLEWGGTFELPATLPDDQGGYGGHFHEMRIRNVGESLLVDSVRLAAEVSAKVSESARRSTAGAFTIAIASDSPTKHPGINPLARMPAAGGKTEPGWDLEWVRSGQLLEITDPFRLNPDRAQRLPALLISVGDERAAIELAAQGPLEWECRLIVNTDRGTVELLGVASVKLARSAAS